MVTHKAALKLARDKWIAAFDARAAGDHGTAAALENKSGEIAVALDDIGEFTNKLAHANRRLEEACRDV